MNPYKLLNVQQDASDDAIKSAYKKQALLCHPDKTGNDPEKLEQFQKLQSAYALLSNKARRSRYDLCGIIEEEPDEDDSMFDMDLTEFSEKDIRMAFMDFIGPDMRFSSTRASEINSFMESVLEKVKTDMDVDLGAYNENECLDIPLPKIYEVKLSARDALVGCEKKVKDVELVVHCEFCADRFKQCEFCENMRFVVKETSIVVKIPQFTRGGSFIETKSLTWNPVIEEYVPIVIRCLYDEEDCACCDQHYIKLPQQVLRKKYRNNSFQKSRNTNHIYDSKKNILADIGSFITLNLSSTIPLLSIPITIEQLLCGFKCKFEDPHTKAKILSIYKSGMFAFDIPEDAKINGEDVKIVFKITTNSPLVGSSTHGDNSPHIDLVNKMSEIFKTIFRKIHIKGNKEKGREHEGPGPGPGAS